MTARTTRRWVIEGLAVAAMAACLAGGCGRRDAATGRPASGGAGEQAIRQIGSTTVLPLAEEWQREFNKQHPEVTISVSGGGSGTGIKALISGTAEIAMSSREIKPAEVEQAKQAGVNPVEHAVAHDGIAVVVHPSNPTREISVEQLSNIYSGLVTDWKAVAPGVKGRIQVVSRDSASGTYEAFKDLVITLQGQDKGRDYAPATLKQGSNQAVLALVAQTKGGIGYVGLGYLDDSVKPLAVVPIGGGAAIAPTVENVMVGEYPVSRALYCYTNGEPTGAVAQYLDWVKGPEGQAVVRDLGFVPVG